MKSFIFWRQLTIYSWTFQATTQLEALNDFQDQSEFQINGSCSDKPHVGSLQISQPFPFHEITEAFMHPLFPPGHQPLERALLKTPSKVPQSGRPRQAPTGPQVCTSPVALECGWSSSSLCAHPGMSQATTKPGPSLSPSTLARGFGACRVSACPASQSPGSLLLQRSAPLTSLIV